MSTQLGDFLISIAASADNKLPPKVLNPAYWPQAGVVMPKLTAIEPSPGISVVYSGDVKCVLPAKSGVTGKRGGIGLAREPLPHEKESSAPSEGASVAETALAAWISDPTWQPRAYRGRYVLIGWDCDRRELNAFTDLFRTYPVYFLSTPTHVICASDLRLILAACPENFAPRVSRAAIYHYLNFSYIPAPHSAIEGIAKLEPGSRLVVGVNQVKIERVADAHYPADLSGNDANETLGLRDHIVQTVSDHLPSPNTKWGTFLSGGTDSSSISGILAKASKTNSDAEVDGFSIGFAESGFDEMAFSRIASKQYGMKPHEKVVDENDTVNFIHHMVKGFDEPFGNSSAVPTFYCAKLAKDDGKDLLIAGDGGDEIYGGNERYAKDQVFNWYHQLPKPAKALGSLIANVLGKIDSHITNRLANMIRRGTMPNPDRFYSDDSFASDHFDELLSADFRAVVGRDDSLQIQRDIFARAATKSELHRLMYLDLKMTIAEGDVVKVVRSAKMAGVDVAFPYLDHSLVNYTGRLPDHFKVRRLKKRYLFKRAMVGILPDEILTKKKQGFGLPISVWLRQGGRMHALVTEVVLSQRALDRGYFKPAFIKQLIERHERGSWDYSSEIFRLLMLELWHREYIDTLSTPQP